MPRSYRGRARRGVVICERPKPASAPQEPALSERRTGAASRRVPVPGRGSCRLSARRGPWFSQLHRHPGSCYNDRRHRHPVLHPHPGAPTEEPTCRPSRPPPSSSRRSTTPAARRLEVVRKRLGRPLTLAEKVLFGHLADPEGEQLGARHSYLQLRPDRVAMQDATAQMALLQFMLAGRDDDRGADDRPLRPPDPRPLGRRHRHRAARSTRTARSTTSSQSASARYGIGFWKPGAGIIHQVVLENYAFPGGMMIGTDSHTPNAGGLGMFAVGVGGADAVDVMAGFPWEVLQPEADRRPPDRQAVGLDLAEGRDPQAARHPDRQGRHQPDRRVLRPRRRARSRAPARGRSPTWAPSSAPRPRSSPSTSAWRPTCAPPSAPRIADLAEANRDLLAADPEVEANPEQLLRRGRRDRPRRPRAAPRRAAHARTSRDRSRKMAADVARRTATPTG